MERQQDAEASDVPRFGLDEFLSVLQIERLEVDHFRGGHGPGSHVFGGQVMAQALLAASATVPGFAVHSLHSYFLLAGDAGRPILFEVDRIRDGRSFATRRVVGVQRGRAIFSLSASFQKPEDGLMHQAPDHAEMPTEAPEELEGDLEYYLGLLSQHPGFQRFAFRFQAVDSRQVEGIHMMPRQGRAALPPAKRTWVRLRGAVDDQKAEALGVSEQSLHAACLAYLSDMDFMSTSLLPHGPALDNHMIQGASLDHSMWFHGPFRADQWLLFSKQSPTASGGRGFVRGQFQRADGTLIASAHQECLIRRRERR